uniref:Uncharacterized protein n=1 Tax=Arundo donax TaxID=35708 RepID=A0A0A9GA87_ARUDO
MAMPMCPSVPSDSYLDRSVATCTAARQLRE